MGWSAVRTVWLKELVDTVRDKRTLYMMILLPLVLMPLIFLLGPVLMQRQATALEEALPTITFVGHGQVGQLERWFAGTGAFVTSRVAALDVEQANDQVRSGNSDLVVYLEQGNDTQDGTALLGLVFESRAGSSANALSRFNEHLRQYNATLVSERLAAHSLAPTLVEPFRVAEVHDLTTDSQIGGRLLGMILPFLIAIWAVTGGMYTAIDVAAGEKERGTLESLIMTPVGRGVIVFGKFLAIVTVAFTAVLLLIGSISLSILYLMPRLMGGDMAIHFAIQPLGVALLLLVMVLFVAMIAALLLALSAFGKSFREGQAYTTGLMFAVMMPGMYFTFVDEIVVATWAYTVPIFNVMLVIRELLEGVYDGTHLAVTVASLAVCAGVAMFASYRVFLNERVLFRT